VRAAATLLFATALASAARAVPPEELFDPLKSIEYDLYDFAPEDQAIWEASRYSAHAVRLDLGSVTLKELFAIQEAQANLRATPWLGFSDRTRYAVVRLLDDAAFFNLQNPSGAHRDSPVLRAQAESRWQAGPSSLWLRADLGTSSAIRFPSAPPQGVQATSDQRSEVDAHLRWSEGSSSAGIRFTARRLDRARTEQGRESALRRGLGFARAYFLLPVLPRLQIRGVALGWGEQARGLDAGAPYQLTRWDFGGRLGAVWAPEEHWRVEGGYVRVHSAQTFESVSTGRWGDKAYTTVRWQPRDRVILRFLISHQVTTGAFGGFDGGFEVIF
jgi:hypothetical protein